MASVRGIRVATAYALWALCVLTALFIAGAALLVALRADPEHVVWGRWTTTAQSLLGGWGARSESVPPALGEEFGSVLRWGAVAGGVLLAGAVLQWMIRPRRA